MAKLSDFAQAMDDTIRREIATGIFVTLRPCPNPAFEGYLGMLAKRARRKLRKTSKGSKGDADVEALSEDSDDFKEAFAYTVLKNIEGADDIPEYTGLIGFDILKKPEMYNFFAACRGEASDLAQFYADEDASDTKN